MKKPKQLRIETRGPKDGICNLCGRFGTLTADHIPPNGVIRPKQVEIMYFSDMLKLPRPSKSSRYLQDGVKYKTLCNECNSGLLGTNYDPTLIKFAGDIRLLLDSELMLPEYTMLETKPNRLVRSVVWHLLAQGLNQYHTGTLIIELTDYFINSTMRFPERINIYYWIYQFSDQVIIKSSGISFHYLNSFSTCMLIKFFPLSFLFVIDEPEIWRLGIEKLNFYLTDNINYSTKIRLKLKDVPAQRWPELPSDEGIVLHSDANVGAIPRTP